MSASIVVAPQLAQAIGSVVQLSLERTLRNKVEGSASAGKGVGLPTKFYTVNQAARSLLCLLVFMTTAFAHAGGIAVEEQKKIEFLIASIESLEGAKFIRNNTVYDAKAAGAHLRLKLRNAGSRVVTAEDFIRVCASISSVSGSPYLIRFADGRTVSSEEFFRGKLAEFGR